ncbi:glycosyltransferase family 2 protein [Bacillus sp. FJAT-45037]|uniref:glycosyltransferase family 2 protein n=1 Tax=Bacillus sp. FJAT-45037 TaxID=2011007 RepID=UPI000C230494|nr:glycosyltransferase family 2 protein [Bacillus sp. FJAT-45037]
MLNSSTPLITIVTAAYNCANFIGETIESAQSQTYTHWEMLIVDDCSKDNTREVIAQYAKDDPRVRLIALTENGGAAVARNHALREARGKYVAFLDSDDLWLPLKLERQLNFMEEHDYAFSFTAYKMMNEVGQDLGQVVSVPRAIDYNGLLKNTIIGCLTVMINVEKTGTLQMPNIRTRQDFALWLSVLKRGYTAYGLDEVLARYRKVEGSISSNKVKAAQKTFYVYRHVEKLSLPYALYCFFHYAFNAVKKHRK